MALRSRHDSREEVAPGLGNQQRLSTLSEWLGHPDSPWSKRRPCDDLSSETGSRCRLTQSQSDSDPREAV